MKLFKKGYFARNRKNIAAVAIVLLGTAFTKALDGDLFTVLATVLLVVVLALAWK